MTVHKVQRMMHWNITFWDEHKIAYTFANTKSVCQGKEETYLKNFDTVHYFVGSVEFEKFGIFILTFKKGRIYC